MMCQDVLDRMLEADPGLLRGDDTADPALAAHLRGCRRCRAVAGMLVDELDTLALGLDALARQSTAHRRRTALAWLPLVAAAVLAAVLLLGRDAARDPATSPGPDAIYDDVPARVAVTLPAGRGGAVMNTSNPNITVVWLYERSEQ